MTLTSDQLVKIRAEAIASTMEDCVHRNFLQQVVTMYVDTLNPDEQISLISSELESQIMILGFDPTTGEEA